MTFKNFFTKFFIVVLLLTAYVIHAGFVVVRVKSPDTNLWIPVPIALGHLAGTFFTLPLPHDTEFEKAMEYREAATEILSQIKDLPDSDFVEITKPNEHVRIFKRGNSLCIHVDN